MKPLFARAAIALAILLSASPLLAVTVGNGANCDFATLNDAINSVPRGGSVSIRLSNNVPADPLLSIDRNLTLVGGYDSCSDTTTNHLTPSVIRGIGNNQPNVHLSGFANPIAVNVSLVNLRIEGGAAPRGAGIRIGAANQVRLSNVVVLDNDASEFGGGIYLDGEDGAGLVIEHDSSIVGNSAVQRGGGIYCTLADADHGPGIDFRTGAVIANTAGAHGGGIYLSDCKLIGDASGSRLVDQNRVDRVSFPSAIVDQFGSASGAGIYARASRITLGSAGSTTRISRNEGRHQNHDGAGTHFEVDHGEGGGLNLVESSVATLINTHVAENVAAQGGGVMIRSSIFSMNLDPAGCTALPPYPGCGSLTANWAQGYDTGFSGCQSGAQSFAGRGGAVAMRGGASVLNSVWIKDNRVDQTNGCISPNHVRYPHGAALDLRESSGLDLFNTVVHGNGDNSADDVIHVDSGALFRAFHSTIAGNSNADDAVLRTSTGTPGIGLFNSILIDTIPLYQNDGSSGALLRAVCVYASSLSTLDDAPISDLRENVAGSNPGFVDAGNDNFRLRADAATRDLCRGDELAERNRVDRVLLDLDGAVRPRIVAGIPARSWDAGAYELQSGTIGNPVDVGLMLDDGGLVSGAGASMGYTVAMANDGPNPVSNAGFSLVLDDRIQLPLAVVPFDAGWNCSQSGRTATCRFANALASGAAAPTVAVQFTAPATPMLITSTAAAILPANAVDTLSTNDMASIDSSIALNSNLEPLFGSLPPALLTGQAVPLPVTVRNHGPDASFAPRLKMSFPASLQTQPDTVLPSTAWICG
ncbi:MAG: hypothetical protein KDI37_16615, partial [Xanthomonadales bacterium]|nr:hypothetical protein [Xanthomonadales bacterium]